jgi:L-seryl-tRNA(Ser) seleniumtransferase
VDTLSSLPSVHQLLEDDRGGRLIAEHGRPLVLFAVQRTLERERAGSRLDEASRWASIEAVVADMRTPRLRPVINATGVVLHTNLGRAPLAGSAAEAASQIATGYSNLELDLSSGKRGSRHDAVAHVLAQLTGAAAAAVVNNGAAATLLMLAALTKGREVLVSRGELIEIGGAFRMPDIMRLSGAKMVEVGTTNRTRAQDYAEAITPRSAALLAVHPSNFQVVGFTERPDLSALARLARERSLLLLYDLGSGALRESRAPGLAHEPLIAESLEAGADLVVCSGDKLLGGPQAGLLLGRADLVAKCLKHPLARAVRVDKLTIAALAATLDLYITGRDDQVPVWQMIRASAEVQSERAGRWAEALNLAGVRAELRPGRSAVGGGSLPGETLETTLVVIATERPRPAQLLDRLRLQVPPVIARIEDDRVVLDPRTVLPGEDERLLEAVIAAAR